MIGLRKKKKEEKDHLLELYSNDGNEIFYIIGKEIISVGYSKRDDKNFIITKDYSKYFICDKSYKLVLEEMQYLYELKTTRKENQ